MATNEPSMPDQGSDALSAAHMAFGGLIFISPFVAETAAFVTARSAAIAAITGLVVFGLMIGALAFMRRRMLGAGRASAETSLVGVSLALLSNTALAFPVSWIIAAKIFGVEIAVP